MGAAFVGIVKSLNCDSCSRYFLNELECESDCCAGKLCNMHLETHETGATAASDSEEDFISDCCELHRHSRG